MMMYMPKIFDKMKENLSSQDMSLYIRHKFMYPTPSPPISLSHSIYKKKNKKISEMDST